MDNVITFMQVQEICPRLTLFSFENEAPVSGSVFQKQVDRIGDSAIKFNRKLKKLYLKTDNLSVSYCNYFLKYLSNQLEYFYLYLTNLNLYEWIEEVGDAYSVQFMERFRRINTFDINFYDEDTIHEIPRGEVSNITTYLKLVHALMDNRGRYCTFIGDPVEMNTYRFKYDANKNLVLEFGIDLEFDIFINENNQREICLPDKIVSRIGFKIINRFSLYYDNDHNFRRLFVKDKVDAPWVILERVLQMRPNLDHFELAELEGALPYHKIDIAPRKGVEVSYLNTNGQAYLKVVRLQNIYEFSKVFQLLLTYLPSIEVLSCNYKFHPKGYSIGYKFNSNDIDLAGFSSSEYFYFNAGIGYNIGVCVIFCFKYTDGDQMEYCYDTREKKIKSFEIICFGKREVKVITIRVDKSVEIILHDIAEEAIGIIENGIFLDLDYPVAMEPYENS